MSSPAFKSCRDFPLHLEHVWKSYSGSECQQFSPTALFSLILGPSSLSLYYDGSSDALDVLASKPLLVPLPEMLWNLCLECPLST